MWWWRRWGFCGDRVGGLRRAKIPPAGIYFAIEPCSPFRKGGKIFYCVGKNCIGEFDAFAASANRPVAPFCKGRSAVASAATRAGYFPL